MLSDSANPGGNGNFFSVVYYFRNDIVGELLSSIYKFLLDAQLSEWQIVRESVTEENESFTFESIDRTYQNNRRNDCFHLYWKSYPDTKVIECVNKNNGFGCNSFPLVDRYNYFEYGEEQIRTANFQRMQQDGNLITTCNIKIAFTEEELMETKGFEIK